MLSSMKKYVDSDDKAAIAFEKDVLSSVKDKIFPGWTRKFKVVNEVDELVFQKCLDKFSKELPLRDTFAMSQEIVRLIMRYNA